MEININLIQEKINSAAKRSGRNPEEVKLMAVSKTRTREEVEEAYSLGLRLFGENRIFEAREKFEGLPSDIDLHLIGHLQSNKAKVAAQTVGCIQSIDKISTAKAVNKYCSALDKTVRILVEINTSGETSKDGLLDDNTLYSLIEEIDGLSHLKIQGLMTMAPFTDDASAIRHSFIKLRNYRDDLTKRYPKIDLSELSMGMSSDFEIAIEEGSTLIRVGTMLFGARK